MIKIKEQKEARKLRRQGKSIKEIAKKIKVSPGSVHRWCFDIEIDPQHVKKLEQRVFDALQRGRQTAAKIQKKKKTEEIIKFKKLGIIDIGELSEREFFIAGVSLYWAEGFKKDSRLGFANSDPNMIKFFLKWLIKCCKVPEKDIRLRVGLNISHKNRVREIEKYWSEITNIDLSQFQKSFFQNFKWKKVFKKPEEYFGVLRIRANKQRQLFRRIHGWIEGLRFQAGCRPVSRNVS